MNSFNIFHTSDWHLGKKLYRYSRLDEHRFFLQWFADHLKKENADLLIISGDIFDSPQLGSDATFALEYFYLFLEQVCKKTQVLMIGGNHDSGPFLDAPSPFLNQKGIHIVGSPKAKFEDHFLCLDIKGVPLSFLALPYFRNTQLLQWKERYLKDTPDIPDGSVGEILFNKFFQEFGKFSTQNNCLFNFLVAHHNFGGIEGSGSEQHLSLSGVSHFPLTWTKDRFDYCALGHIHKKFHKQEGKTHFVYPGPPIPLRFSEAGQKSVAKISGNDSADAIKVDFVPIPTARKLYSLSGNLTLIESELAKIPNNDGAFTPYLEAKLVIDGPDSNLTGKLKALCQEKALELISIKLLSGQLQETGVATTSDNDVTETFHISSNEDDACRLFQAFYQEKYRSDSAVPPAIFHEFKEVLALAQLQQNEDAKKSNEGHLGPPIPGRHRVMKELQELQISDGPKGQEEASAPT